MGLITRAGDLVYTFRFLKLLVTPFNETKAYEYGIIDDKGNRIKTKKDLTSEEMAAYSSFHRLVFNIKKLMEKAPGGSSRLASYAAALYLIKEHLELSDQAVNKIIAKSDLDLSNELQEQSHWFVVKGSMLSPGIYRVAVNGKMINEYVEERVNLHDKVRVENNCYPVGQINGIDIYSVQHVLTGCRMYITTNEIVK